MPKYMPRAQKRKRKQREKTLIQSQIGDIDKYFIDYKRVEREEIFKIWGMWMIMKKWLMWIHHENETNSEDPQQPEHEEDDVHMIEDVQHEDLNQESCFPSNIFLIFLNFYYLLKNKFKW